VEPQRAAALTAAADASAPQGLVVDFGGVLTTSMRAGVLAFAEREDVDPAQIAEVLAEAYAEDAEAGDVAALETGRLPLAEFEPRLGARLRTRAGGPVEADGLVGRLFSSLEIDAAMVAAVGRLHDRGVRTALLSNTWGVEQVLREEVLQHFDATVLSGDVGLRKPHPEIYRLALERLALPAPACVFVDDFEVNVTAAERLGMRGIVHTDTDETIRRLDAVFPAG